MSVKFSRTRLAEEIIKRLDSGESVDQVAQEVAAFLITQGKTSELSSLLRDCTRLRADKDGVVEVNALTAHPIDDSLKKQIEKTVLSNYKNARKVVIHSKIDPDVIGGVSLSFVNSSLDLSIRARLNKLKALAS